MSEESYQYLQPQPGIDWTKAARIAMGVGREANDSCHLSTAELYQAETSLTGNAEASNASIKYPVTIGKHLNRVPERDSFLRGGTQFSKFQQAPKAG